jgi:hypothetical protein
MRVIHFAFSTTRFDNCSSWILLLFAWITILQIQLAQAFLMIARDKQMIWVPPRLHNFEIFSIPGVSFNLQDVRLPCYNLFLSQFSRLAVGGVAFGRTRGDYTTDSKGFGPSSR